jgi:hypothetical protein
MSYLARGPKLGIDSKAIAARRRRAEFNMVNALDEAAA